MAQPDRAKIIAAIKVLEDEGRKAYLPEYQATTDRWDCIGLALAKGDDEDRGGIVRAAYAYLEDWNYHPECAALQAALPWAFPGETNETDVPDACECDSTHKAVDTVCRWCWAHGRRHWNDPEVEDSHG